ncbi:MAG: FmdB family zinc ribbon protein [Ilumatobacteraceae bacterium]|jgi:putative FmdB family regulatory protein
MPAYEFRCRQCGDTFVLNRPMSQSSDPANCPRGHADTVRLLNVAAVAGGTQATGLVSGASAPTGGGCCGGGCCG